MPYTAYDFHPVSHITIDAIGPPGQRTFLLQASYGTDMVSLVIEKEQAAALAYGIQQILEEIAERYPERSSADVETVDVTLRQPVVEGFRVGHLGLAYDEESDLLVIVAQQLMDEVDAEAMISARFWATRGQMIALSEHALEVVEAGRPICPRCGEPMEEWGHFCPRSNGHGRT
jgi:uncharacterized repeat protein (TIGR03847 family)